jgi:hypothetical protein
MTRETRPKRPKLPVSWPRHDPMELRGGYLVRVAPHATDDFSEPLGEVEHGRMMFNEFRALEDAPESSVVAFANRWGRLGLCVHGWPPLHRTPACSLVDSEPVSAWLNWSAAANLIVRMASALHAKRRVDPVDRDALLTFHRTTDGHQMGEWGIHPRRPDLFDRRNVGIEVNRWLALARLPIMFSWDERTNQTELRFAPPTAFSAIALSLAAAVGHIEAFPIMCGGMGEPECEGWLFPTKSTNTFCPPCREAKVPDRLARRRWRANPLNRERERAKRRA